MVRAHSVLIMALSALTAGLTDTVQAQNPIANDDYEMTDSRCTIQADVLMNDYPGWFGTPIDPTTVEIVSGPNTGSASVDPWTGAITYQPLPGFACNVSIEYGALDYDGNPTNVAVLYIWVFHIPPMTTGDGGMTQYDTPLVLEVLSNDTCGTAPINPDSIEITSQPQHGTVAVGTGGLITYTPGGVQSVSDSFEYRVYDEDGVASESTQVYVWVMNMPPSITGWTGWQASAGYWYFEGYVTDEDPLSCTVEFGGILAGEDPVTPRADGKFSFAVDLGTGALNAPATAVARDNAGQESSEEMTVVYNYY